MSFFLNPTYVILSQLTMRRSGLRPLLLSSYKKLTTFRPSYDCAFTITVWLQRVQTADTAMRSQSILRQLTSNRSALIDESTHLSHTSLPFSTNKYNIRFRSPPHQYPLSVATTMPYESAYNLDRYCRTDYYPIPPPLKV